MHEAPGEDYGSWISTQTRTVDEREREERRVNTVVTLAITVFFPFFFKRVTPEHGTLLGPLYLKTWNPKTGDYDTNVSCFINELA